MAPQVLSVAAAHAESLPLEASVSELSLALEGTPEHALPKDHISGRGARSSPPVPRVVNVHTSEEIQCNPVRPHSFESELFRGDVVIKIKTDPPCELYEPYFHNKKRMFEFQVQGELTSADPIDASRLFIGIETPKPVKMGSITWLMASVIRKFIHTKNPHASTSFGETVKSSSSTRGGSARDHVAAHISLPLATAVDRLVITEAGEAPPALGVDMLPETLTKEERMRLQCMEPGKQYSVSMHGMYVDFAKWSVVHIPGVPDVSLTRFLGDQPIRVVCYAVRDPKRPHTDSNKDYLFAFELAPPAPTSMPSSTGAATVSSGVGVQQSGAPIIIHTKDPLLVEKC